MGIVADKATNARCLLQAGRQRCILKKNERFLAKVPLDWDIVVEDESIFIYDVKVRKVWAIKGSRPRILTTGSHKKICWFGSLSDDGTQLFRKYETADSDAFLDYMAQLKRKHPKMVIFLDKASYHKKEARVKRFFRKNKHCIKVHWFPSGFPESNPVEECWNQGETSILGSTFYDSFNDFEKACITFFRTRRFMLDLYKYLCP
ncbi:MAG: transposase [Nanoarchaeota archaeon]